MAHLYAVKHKPIARFDNVQRNTDPHNGLGNVIGLKAPTASTPSCAPATCPPWHSSPPTSATTCTA